MQIARGLSAAHALLGLCRPAGQRRAASQRLVSRSAPAPQRSLARGGLGRTKSLAWPARSRSAAVGFQSPLGFRRLGQRGHQFPRRPAAGDDDRPRLPPPAHRRAINPARRSDARGHANVAVRRRQSASPRTAAHLSTPLARGRDQTSAGRLGLPL